MRKTRLVPLASARHLVESVEALGGADKNYRELLWKASDLARVLHAWRVARVCNWLGYYVEFYDGTFNGPAGAHVRAVRVATVWLHAQEVARL